MVPGISIEQISTGDMRKLIEIAAFRCLIILLASIVSSVVAIFQAGLQGMLIFLLFWSPIWILGIIGTVYNFGRLYGLFPMQPKGIKTWVAKSQEKTIAWADVSQNQTYSVLESLYVETDFRGKGIGSSLVQCLAEEVCKPLYVQSSHYESRFYKRLGFVVVSRKDLPAKLIWSNPVGALKNMVLI
jgi:GNAT superfamily N-acetyltransferase